MTKITLYSKRKTFFAIFLFVAIFFLSFNLSWAYSTGDSTASFSFDKTYRSIFNQNPFKFSPIDISRFIKKDNLGLSFNDLVNTESFSADDLRSSAKAVLVLLIRLTVTTLNVTLGILKVLLDTITS